MTSKLTRERIEWLNYAATGLAANGTEMAMSPQDVIALTESCLAAMDSEPVATLDVQSGRPDGNKFALAYSSAAHKLPDDVYYLYRHAQPVVQPMMFIDGDISSEDADKLAKVIREFNEEDERPLAKMARIIRENPHPTNECDMPKVQPAPVVPDEMLCDFYEVSNWPDLVRELVKHVEQLQDSAKRNVKPWEDTFPETLLPAYIDRIKQVDEACRAAMLQAGNSPVIPDGYVMVPKEPTENMVIDGFESAPDEDFSEPEVWEEYQNMSGCQQAAHRARLCWAAMIAAAPKQENI